MVHAQTDSIDYYKKELQIKKATKDFTPKDTSYIKLLNKLSTKFKNIQTDTIGVLAAEALALSNSIDFEMGTIEALSNLAIYEIFNGNREKSIAYNKQVLQILDINKFPELGANIYDFLGSTYLKIGNYYEAYKHMYQSLLLAEITNKKDLISKTNSSLGSLFSFLEDYDEALKFYQVALNGFEEKDESIAKATLLINLGYLFMEKHDYDQALEFLDQSVLILENANATERIPYTYLIYGKVYFQKNNFDKALYYYERANNYYKSSKDIVTKARSLYGLGISNTAINEFQKAEEFLNLSLDHCISINFKEGVEKTYRALYELNKKKKSEEKALYYLEQAQAYASILYNEKNLRDISMWRAKTEFDLDKAAIEQKTEGDLVAQKKYTQWAGLGLGCAIIIAILVFQINKTERKLNKSLAVQGETLFKKQEELNKINHNQDKFFSIVGHDLRGPIVSLKQLLGLAMEDESGIQHFYRFGPKLKKDVDHIHFALDNLLNWGTTQMKGEPVNPVQINVKNELLLIEDLFRDLLDKKSITVSIEILPDVILSADVNHFKIIFRNLVSNAIKFTPENGIISLASTEENDSIVIAVKDNGIGMSDKVIDQIFNMSEYYTTFGTNNERGTGLGVMLCKEMVLKNSGAVWVESSVGKGSTFYVRLPKANIA